MCVCVCALHVPQTLYSLCAESNVFFVMRMMRQLILSGLYYNHRLCEHRAAPVEFMITNIAVIH